MVARPPLTPAGGCACACAHDFNFACVLCFACCDICVLCADCCVLRFPIKFRSGVLTRVAGCSEEYRHRPTPSCPWIFLSCLTPRVSAYGITAAACNPRSYLNTSASNRRETTKITPDAGPFVAYGYHNLPCSVVPESFSITKIKSPCSCTCAYSPLLYYETFGCNPPPTLR